MTGLPRIIRTRDFARLTGYTSREIQRLTENGVTVSARHGRLVLKDSLTKLIAQARMQPDALKTAAEIKKLKQEVALREERLQRLRDDTINKQEAEKYLRGYAASCAAHHGVDVAEILQKHHPDIDREIMEWWADEFDQIKRFAAIPVLPDEALYDE